MKQRLVESNARRIAAIEAGEQVVVGVNRFTDGAPSPLTAGDGSILTVDPGPSRIRSKPSGPGAPSVTPPRSPRRWPNCAPPRPRAATSWSRRSPAPMRG